MVDVPKLIRVTSDAESLSASLDPGSDQSMRNPGYFDRSCHKFDASIAASHPSISSLHSDFRQDQGEGRLEE